MKQLVTGISNALHTRLKTQARNLLFEYKYGCTDEKTGTLRGHVPVEHIEPLMRLYGDLVIAMLLDDLSAGMDRNIRAQVIGNTHLDGEQPVGILNASKNPDA
jgi:hypothetical protein